MVEVVVTDKVNTTTHTAAKYQVVMLVVEVEVEERDLSIILVQLITQLAGARFQSINAITGGQMLLEMLFAQ
jgi:hypothetical protein